MHTYNPFLQGGAFADFVQLSLAAFGLGGLLVKRAKETPRRPWKIWGMDVGKQCLGRCVRVCVAWLGFGSQVVWGCRSVDRSVLTPSFHQIHTYTDTQRSLYAHFVNMLLAMGLSTLAGGGLDECAWYAVNYLTDSSL